MTVLVLLRHGQTEYNAEGRLQGSLDVPLGEHGRNQAAAAARAIVDGYGVPDRIVTSPLSRARDTAAAVGALVPVPVTVDRRLRQRSYGEWEGLTWDEVKLRWPRDYERRLRGEDPQIAGWDVAAEVSARVSEALAEACDGARLVVVVSHGSAIMLGSLALLGLDAHATTLGKLPHAHWNVLATAHGGWSLARYGLSAAAAD
ncbi:histidine phosphatase family protein [Demequina sp. SYSU T00039]|uniref:Histidine phosphatase family protein n=1 Tax=Demequina lignilytica TaxID=3051663 RepID=A0AAW7M7L3_9MICO|nr:MULTISPECIES: histidine phosphatase family protein [unclassified Demequina]MDN4478378.1 histidine phosphatase family protein [Demequina sp. SYSU T00039-1]MDN4487115.1 histidine phosphatase family protein [Demequina sp. SYSU T00039]MDN4489826.1 histidine phosphatase family protein [Demequina sp. SYSU T00068]